jgi:replicative DNA helicase
MVRPPKPSPSPVSLETRTLPHNLEAEKAVLGTFFLNDKALLDVQSLLTPEDFYDPRHQDIYRVVLDLVEQDKPIDPVLLINELDRRGLLEKTGGPAYLTGLEQSVISPGNVRHHAELVREKSLLRRLIQITGEISDDAITERKETQEILEESEKRIFEILTGRVTNEFRSIGEEAHDVYREMERRAEARREVTGVTTGLSNLDRLTGGLQPSDLIILAARPSVGKTSLALNMAMAAAESGYMAAEGVEGPPGIGVFSLEMNRQQIIQRMVCGKAEIRMDLLRKNMLNENQMMQFGRTLDEMSNLAIYINDTPNMSPIEMRLHAQRLKARCPNLALIVVDYLQLMSGGSKRSESRQQEVSEISRALKGLARDLHVPVLALSQLSRGVESRRGADAKPRLSDLRESGAIEQDADVVMFLHRAEPRVTDGEKVGRAPIQVVDLIVAKQRNGPVGEAGLLFREEFTQFVVRHDD